MWRVELGLDEGTAIGKSLKWTRPCTKQELWSKAMSSCCAMEHSDMQD